MDGIANSMLCDSTSYLAKRGFQNSQNLQSDPEFTRADWQVYISNLPQGAGVLLTHNRALVLKELVDNALDEMDRVGQPGRVTLTQDSEDIYTVTNQGRGEIRRNNSRTGSRFAKGMVSSKQWRRPTRGCVGNGLRVIVGAVASGGGRIIETHHHEGTLRPRLNGTTATKKRKAVL
jgi:hypothetical protein